MSGVEVREHLPDVGDKVIGLMRGMPSSIGSCDMPMIRAAALMKPISTGCDRKLSSTPSRTTPKMIWNMPAISASSTTSAMKDALPCAASGAMLAAVSSAVSAAGPVDSCGSEPIIAAAMVGRNAA